MPRGKCRPSSSARSNVTWPVMSDGRSSRLSQRARFSRSTSTAPAPCQPGTDVSSVRRALDAAARAGESQVGRQPIDRTFQRRVERGVDRDVFQAADHAGPLLKREARRAHLQVQRRRLRPRVDRAVERVAPTARSATAKLLEEPAVRAAAEPSASADRPRDPARGRSRRRARSSASSGPGRRRTRTARSAAGSRSARAPAPKSSGSCSEIRPSMTSID